MVLIVRHLTMGKVCNGCKINKEFKFFNTKRGHKGKIRYNYICKECQSKKYKKRNLDIKNSVKKKVSEKKCNQCLNIKAHSEFTIDNYQKTGLSKLCKECQSKYYFNNREKKIEWNKKSQLKNKDKCNKRKLIWAKKNKEKVKKANKDYYNRNKEKVAAANKKWADENPLAVREKGHRYRAKKKKNTIQRFSNEDLQKRMSVFGYSCAYCGGDFEHIDHVKPISKGGPHCLANLRPSCKSCNLRKHNKSLSEWIKEKDRYN